MEVCLRCGARTDLFGAGGGERLAVEVGVPLLGSIPIDQRVVTCGDEGSSLMDAWPVSVAAQCCTLLAARLHESPDLWLSEQGAAHKEVAMIHRLRIAALADNSGGAPGMLAEHGLSILVEADDRRILFDTGQGRVLRSNLAALRCPGCSQPPPPPAR